jgi:hypothetical protein
VRRRSKKLRRRRRRRRLVPVLNISLNVSNTVTDKACLVPGCFT